MKFFCKNKNLNSFLAIFAFVIIAGFLFFGNISSAKADTLYCECYKGGSPSNPDNINERTDFTVNDDNRPTQAEVHQCNTQCQSKGNDGGFLQDTTGAIFEDINRAVNYVSPENVIKRNVVDPLANGIGAIFKSLLVIVLIFVGMLLSVAASIFEWITQVGNFKSVVDGPTVYTAWQNVRDVLNIAFILVLLYSAFCTILQIESYNYKKILLKLVIMALLVNFSFPITRFIIDTSNVLMYTIIKTLLPEQGSMLFSAFSSPSVKAILSQGIDASSVSLLASIVFVFILAITLLAIAILFVIRMIVLTILIIFSPLAFVATIFPDTGSYSSKWWDNLFKYSFFGPIMMFMLYISAQIMVSTIGIDTSLSAIAQKNSIEPGLIAAMSNFAVPIVILWMGMGIAQSMSIAGAGAVMGGAQKFIKGAGKKFSGFNAIKKQYTDYKKERDARKEEARLKPGKWLGEKANDAQDSIYAKFGSTKAQKRIDKRKTDKNKKEIDEGAKDLVDKGATTDTLAQQMNTHFSAPPPTTKKDKVDQAKSATAYLRQDSDERKMHIQNTINAKGGLAGSDLDHIVNATPPPGMTVGSSAYNSYMNAQNEARFAAMAIAGGSTNENDIRKVAAFVNSQMKRRVDIGANA